MMHEGTPVDSLDFRPKPIRLRTEEGVVIEVMTTEREAEKVASAVERAIRALYSVTGTSSSEVGLPIGPYLSFNWYLSSNVLGEAVVRRECRFLNTRIYALSWPYSS